MQLLHKIQKVLSLTVVETLKVILVYPRGGMYYLKEHFSITVALMSLI